MSDQEYSIDLPDFEEWTRHRYDLHGQRILDQLRFAPDMRFTFSGGYGFSGIPPKDYEWLVDVRIPTQPGFCLAEVPQRFFTRIDADASKGE
jgi:hypothetical protein